MADRFSEYPMNFNSLQVGDVITVDEIEKHFDVEYGTEDYRWTLFALSSAINKETEFTASSKKGEICVLAWQEASGYNSQMQDNGIRKIYRSVRKQLQVKTDTFSPELKTTHSRRLLKGAFLLEALKSAKKKLITSESKQIKPKHDEDKSQDKDVDKSVSGT